MVANLRKMEKPTPWVDRVRTYCRPPEAFRKLGFRAQSADASLLSQKSVN